MGGHRGVLLTRTGQPRPHPCARGRAPLHGRRARERGDRLGNARTRAHPTSGRRDPGVAAERSAALVDGFTGRPESGVESLFVRRTAAAGFTVESQVDLAGFGRYDGVINGCVLFEIDGHAFHSGFDRFFADRDRTLVGQAFGVPVVRPSARHVLEDWPMVLAAVVRSVEDAELVRRARRLPPISG